MGRHTRLRFAIVANTAAFFIEGLAIRGRGLDRRHGADEGNQ